MTEMDLSKCVVCGEDALFTDSDPGANPVSYCAADLPAHMADRANAGQMPLQTDETGEELMEEARRLDIDGRSTMNKAQLQTAVAAARLSEATGGNEAPPVIPDVPEESLVAPEAVEVAPHHYVGPDVAPTPEPEVAPEPEPEPTPEPKKAARKTRGR